MSLPKETRTYSYEDYLKWTGEEKWELNIEL